MAQLCTFQVSFEGDPEGALVTFSTNAEAAACYKCSEPVFNNRFIKVFWHNKEKQETTTMQVLYMSDMNEYYTLTHCSRETCKRIIGKQCRPRSDSALFSSPWEQILSF